MIDLSKFDWGWMDEPTNLIHIYNDGTIKSINDYHKEALTKEIFTDKIYERFFEVKENDVVLDIGSSVGPFTYSILHKKPFHVYCVEPSEREFKTLVKNTRGNPVTHILKGITDRNEIVQSSMLFGGEGEMEGITFEKLISLYSIDKVNFLKTDCEGGEYHIFTESNRNFIQNKVEKIVGEWHLSTPELKKEFRNFRDNYLSGFKNIQVFSIDGYDIQWDLWNDHFIQYYNEVTIYIDNSK